MLLKIGFLCILFTIGCNDHDKKSQNDRDTTTVMLDSVRNIEMSIPDSMTDFNLKNAAATISQYFDESERFYIDTVSTLSTASLKINERAYKLRQKLMAVLPKFSLTTGVGENKFTRDYFIIEGDIKTDRDRLLLYCKKRLLKVDTSVTERLDGRKLTVAADRNGRAAIWPKGATIKYCIMRSSFATKILYDSVVDIMKNATKDWMNICNVRFEYLPNLDRQNIDVETYPEEPLFVVRQIEAYEAFIAQAFFPSDPVYERMLLIDNSFFTSSYNKTGVIRHELGHILGFRHEHIRSNDASCGSEKVIDEELGAISKTPYDPYSVMHYPCGLNSGNQLLELTEFDREGSRKVYPFGH